ncbi:phage integrase N-terminal SAM-like domain-containing protein [Candidatus Woesearchaeota archaeon]|nr:phage integrase N-terminal SAM-like domain-containing protein [Candidatus Woesearchaeota archaeon]
MDVLERFGLELDARGFSSKTKKSYRHFVNDFLGYSAKHPQDANSDDVKQYISYLINAKHYTNVTANLAISALKFFFVNAVGKEIEGVARPKREQNLHVVLSKEEVRRIIGAANNAKHRLVLKCLYGRGLRVSELVDLRTESFDFGRI